MSDRSLTPTALTRRAIQAAESGNLSESRQLLAEALRSDPRYEPAWLWYAHVAETEGERKFCLQEAASLNEESQAKAALARFARVEPEEPALLQDILDPDAPPTLTDGAEERGRRIPPALMILGAIAGIALLAGLIFWQMNNRKPDGSPLYIAFASGLSAANADTAIEMQNSIQLEIDQLNADGGIDGHPVELLAFDDENDAEKARAVAEKIAADDRILAVIGHRTSSASLAAAPIYSENGIPAVTSTANVNAVTASNPFYFRTIFNNQRQGTLIAAGIPDLLGLDEMILVAGEDVYGQSLGNSVSSAFEGTVRGSFTIPDEAGIPAVVAEIAALDSDAPIVLAMQATLGRPLIVALRDAGLGNRLIGGDSFGSDTYLRSFSQFPDEQSDPGHYTDGLIAVAPLFMDSLSADALRWSQQFQDAYQSAPSWYGATTADAALAVLHAIEQVGVDPNRSNDETRISIRNELAALNEPENSIPGILGPIWFDEMRSAPRNIAVGMASDQTYSSAPVQFTPFKPSGEATLDSALESGAALEIDGTFLQRQRIVFTGLNINEVTELDLNSQSFHADFFIWFRYQGGDDATDVVFLNSADPSLALGEPIRESKAGSETYRLYRVDGTFKAQMDFRAFPFDTQNLPIQIQNRALPSGQLVYALDRSLRDQPMEVRLMSGVDADATIDNIPNWLPIELNFYQQSIGSTAALGDPTLSLQDQGIEYSVLTTDFGIRRDVDSFLVKNLLPLTLLVIVTYVSLFFSHSQTGARVSFGVTGILTTAVLLTEVTSSLPDIGYNVAIEWAFYAFIGLCAGCILVGLIGDSFYEKRELGHLRQLDIVARILYPAIVIAVVLAYWFRFRA